MSGIGGKLVEASDALGQVLLAPLFSNLSSAAHLKQRNDCQLFSRALLQPRKPCLTQNRNEFISNQWHYY